MFVANVVFIGPSSGGRDTPPQSGYHPQIKAGDEYTSCVIESLRDEVVFDFDKEHLVSLRLMFPEGHESKFSVGSSVSFFEGSHLIGSGTIVDVLRRTGGTERGVVYSQELNDFASRAKGAACP